jgi:hypothetical protein
MLFLKSKSEMETELNQLTMDKMRLDKFFSLYLDKFGSKMNHEKPDTKIWALYKQKMTEYSNMNVQIKTLQYRISKAK